MLFYKKRISYGVCMLLLTTTALMAAKKDALSIHFNKKKVTIRAEKRSLDEVVLLLADYCSINVSLHGDKWPVVSVFAERKSCDEAFMFLTKKYRLRVESKGKNHVIDSAQDSTELVETLNAAKDVYAAFSKEVIRRHKMFVAGPQQIGIAKGATDLKKIITQIDVPREDFLLTVFIMAVNLDQQQSRQNIIDIVSKYFQTKRHVFNPALVADEVIKYLGLGAMSQAELTVSPVFHVVVPGKVSWSGQASVPSGEFFKKKASTELSFSADMSAISGDQLLFHVKLKLGVPQKQGAGVTYKENKAQLSVPVQLGRAALIYGFYSRYHAEEQAALGDDWLSSVAKHFLGGSAHARKTWVGAWVFVEKKPYNYES
jgi:hypothetical protein